MRRLDSILLALTAGLFVHSVIAAPKVFIPLGEAGQVQVIDTDQRRVVDVIDGVGNAHGLAIPPDGRYLVVGSFTEENPGDNPTRPAGMSEAEHQKHHSIDASGAGESAGVSYVSIIGIESRKVARQVAVRGAVHHVAVSPDGRYAVTTHPGNGTINVIDLDQFDVIATVTTGSSPNYAVFAPDSGVVYVSNTGDNNISEIDVASWSVSRRIPTGLSPEHVVLSADGRTLYTNNVGEGTASVIALREGRVTRTFDVGASPHGLELSDDGATLFTVSKAENQLVAIDLATEKLRKVQLAPAPYHVTAVRGSATLYVSSRADPRVWVIDQGTLELRGEMSIGGIGHQMVVATSREGDAR